MKSQLAILIALAAFVAGQSTAAFGPKKDRPIEKEQVMKPQETMVLNLNRGVTSPKFFLLSSMRQSKGMQHNLFRAMRQVEQTDANYAKTGSRPDDRTMTGTVARFKQAIATAEKLQQDLEACNAEMKNDIQNTLIQH